MRRQEKDFFPFVFAFGEIQSDLQLLASTRFLAQSKVEEIFDSSTIQSSGNMKNNYTSENTEKPDRKGGKMLVFLVHIAVLRTDVMKAMGLGR